MDKEIAEEEEALLLLLPRRRTGQKRKKKHKKPRFWVRDNFRPRQQYEEYSD